MLMETIRLWEGREDVTLTAYVTEPDRSWPIPSDPRPAVIICPGGAYLHLSDAEATPIAMAMSARGYQSFVLEYSVATRVEDAAHCRYPAQVLDLAKAMVTVRQNAEKWNVNCDQVVTMGFSAGGHTCAHFITKWHEPWVSEAVGTDREQLRPNAAVLCYPLTDYVLQQERADAVGDQLSRVSNQSFLGKKSPAMEVLEQQSPCRHVTDNAPPTFLVHAANDSMVPVAHSLRMAEGLAAAGVPYEMHIFQEGDHGFGLGQLRHRPWERHHDLACGVWVDLAARWLLKYFAPETAEPSSLPPEMFM